VVKLIHIPGDQCLFLGSTPSLDLPLPVNSVYLGGNRLMIKQIRNTILRRMSRTSLADVPGTTHG
jgi:hypothetical protein